MEEIKVFRLNDYEWWATKGELEDLIEWYRENIDNSESVEEMLDEAKECNLDTEGVWYETIDENDIKILGEHDELLNKNLTGFGSLKRYGSSICKLISFREAIGYDLNFTEPYCIASSEY